MKINSRKLAVVLATLALCGQASAGKPKNETGMPFGNGFPSGEHFNLNLIGKKAHFECPSAEFDENNLQVFGNVIYMSRDPSAPITILMESGTKGPKGAPETSRLEVTDWCTDTIADANGAEDPAILRLPANANGYAVYARITGKPGDSTQVDITQGAEGSGLAYVEDEKGNDLLALGIVDKDGTAKFSSSMETLYRTASDTWSVSYETQGSRKGKGTLKARDISGLFHWSGEVCYVSDVSGTYCADGNCSPLDLCCNGVDGVYSSCVVKTEDVCPAENPLLVTAMCRTYEDDWVFNIGDYVGYLWDIANNGAYVVQVRFYPID